MQWRKLLLPFSPIYGGITALRNWAFERDWLQRVQFGVPTLAIGNLSTGGTGKSPMAALIMTHFAKKSILLVSRGYGRKSKGFREVKVVDTAELVGDEPLQLKRQFPHQRVVVSEKRVEGIETALKQGPKPNLILLDDAFQHRYVQAHVYILLSNYQQLFTRDFPLPGGNLREGRSGASRADLIVITKCPTDLSTQEAKGMEEQIARYSEATVFFARYQYSEAVNAHGEVLPAQAEAQLILGIAQPGIAQAELSERYTLVKSHIFPDHHAYTTAEINGIVADGQPQKYLCSDKDWQRLESLWPKERLDQLYVIGVEHQILFDEEARFKRVLNSFL